MHTTSSIVMRVPKERIFETAADLSRWPEFLPHYRYIHYYEKSPARNIVKMAATRSGIPIAWTSEEIIDRDKLEVRFRHLKAFTKGMEVVWKFSETEEGVLVEIVHGSGAGVLAHHEEFFIENIANKTLRCMKEHLEIGDCGL